MVARPLLDNLAGSLYPRDGRRKVEVEETALLALPIFENCPGCFARLHYGTVVDSCDCIRHLLELSDATP